MNRTSPVEAETAPALLPEPFLKWFAQRGWSPRAHQIQLLAKAQAGIAAATQKRAAYFFRLL